MTNHKFEIPFGRESLIIETGKMAKQADGAVTVQYGGTLVLVTVVISKEAKPEQTFMPLIVDYIEKTYAAGKIPGGFFKREGRPSEKEILSSRLIDRPIRPLFSQSLRNEVQVVATVLSHDGVNEPDVLAMVGASAALAISGAPFQGPIGAVRVGRIDGELIVNPTYEEVEKVQNPCAVEDIAEVDSGEGEETTVGDKIMMFHNGQGPMCLDALDFIETIDYPVEEYLNYEEGFDEELNGLKTEFGQSEGVSQSFGYYPIIFIRDRAFSGFSEEIKSEILKEIAK